MGWWAEARTVWRWVVPRVVATAGALLVLWGTLEVGPRNAPYPSWPRGCAAVFVGLLAMIVGGPAAAPTRAARAREALGIVFVALLSFVLLFVHTQPRPGG
jgi:hypothetical protein